MRLLIINNLSAGFANSAIYDFLRYFSEDSDEICMRYTDGTSPIEELLGGAGHFDAVISSGGDGTATAIAYALKGRNIAILPFPAGTGNLLASNLYLPFEPHELARIVRAGKTLNFDIGEIETTNKRYGFSIMAGAGYDAAIMQGAKPSKKFLGSIAYFQSAISNALPQSSSLHLEVDGKIIDTTGLGVLIANFPRIQFDIPLLPHCSARDGLLEIALLKAQNAFELIPAFIAGIRDRDGEYPDRGNQIEILEGKEIRFGADPAFDIQYDGETPGLQTPFTARVLPQASRFIVDEKSFGKF